LKPEVLSIASSAASVGVKSAGVAASVQPKRTRRVVPPRRMVEPETSPRDAVALLAVFPKNKANVALALWGMVTVVAPIQSSG
jgi:hypothetical protein